MKRSLLIVVGVVVIAAGILLASSAFIVRQTEQAIVLQFGDPRRVIQEPGLHFKLPFVQDVTYFDNRILDFAPPQEEIIAADQKRLVVDSFVRYRIADPLEFYKAVGTELAARARLAGIVSAALRRTVGNAPLAAILSSERAELMSAIRADTNEAAVRLGINIVDFRIRRADLPQANAEAIYQRMQSEREREAREFRAQGAEIAQRIRARAERERTVLLAESQRQSQVLRGEGDSEAIRIYAEAFGQDPEFFSFYRSMEAYRNALKADGTTMVLSPDSDFFRYFHNPGGVQLPGSQLPAPPAAETQASGMQAPEVQLPNLQLPSTETPRTELPSTEPQAVDPPSAQ